MGLFNFFKKKSEPQEITFKELETWIDSFLEKKDVSKRIEGFKQFSENKIKEARDAINELESATLLNEKIPERVKHILSGNRKNYIQKINFFLDDLEFPKKRTEIRTFSIELSKKIDKLSEETQKSFFVLKEFLETEAATVAKKIKEIESESIKLRRLVEQENLELIDDILKLKNDYTQAKNVKEILEKEKENKQTELQEIIQKEKKLQNKIAEIEKSTRYKEYLGLGRKIQASKEKIKETKKELLQKFALIERPLKKYKRTSLDEKLIDEYLQNPSAALKEDKNLKILAILEKLKEKLESLGIKDKKIGKTKEEITTINKEFLERKNKELAELEEQQKNYEQQIKANISNLNLMEEKTHLESIIEQRKLKEREIEDIENKMERSNPKFIKQKIKDSLKKIDVILKT